VAEIDLEGFFNIVFSFLLKS